MKNYAVLFEGPKNKWGDGYIQWLCLGFETAWSEKKLSMLNFYFWLFGFQLFEFSIRRKK